MRYGNVPEQFAQVSLSNRRTWHRATLREWLDMRSHLLEKERRQGDQRELEKVKIDDSLTGWEFEFLGATRCFDEIIEEIRKPRGSSSNIYLLFNWLNSVEEECGLAQRRESERERNHSSIAPISDRRLKSRKIPFYPRPLEMIHIDRAADILLANIKNTIETFLPMGEPIPGTEDPDSFRVRQFLKSAGFRDLIIRFVNDLKSLGYYSCEDEQNCLTWTGWTSVFSQSNREAQRSFLCFLFSVESETIRKDVSWKRLQRLYHKYGVAESWRHYIERYHPPDEVTLLRSGWYQRLVHGEPSRYDIGTFYRRLLRA